VLIFPVFWQKVGSSWLGRHRRHLQVAINFFSSASKFVRVHMHVIEAELALGRVKTPG